MHWLPVIQRELQIAARRRSTYGQRVMVGGIAGTAMIVFTFFNPAISAQSGRDLFRMMAWALFLYSMLEGLRETADTLAQERREGTLHLLFLTHLRPRDIVLGKLGAGAIKSFTALLSALPIVALPLWLGGVTMAECGRVMLTLSVSLAFSLVSGIFISSFSKNAFVALIGSAIFVLLVMLIPTALFWSTSSWPHWIAGPFGMFNHAMDPLAGLLTSSFHKATIYSILLCVVLLWLSGLTLARTWNRESNSTPLFASLLKPTMGLGELWGGQSSEAFPPTWLGEKNLPARRILWLLLTAASGFAFVLGAFFGIPGTIGAFVMQFLLGFLIKFWVAALAVQPLNIARRTGALELLLYTPISPDAWVRGQMDALRAYFFAPGLLVAFGPVICGSLGSAFFFPKSTGEEIVPFMIYGVFWFLLFQLDLSALCYTGLWFGLTEAHTPRALTKTLFRIMVLPWLTLLIPLLGFFGLIIWPWAWMAWSAKKLNTQLKEQAGKPINEENKM